jgi:hypothetical protein
MSPDKISSHWDLHPWEPGERKLMLYVEVPRWLQKAVRSVQHLATVHVPGVLAPIPGEWLHVTVLVLPPDVVDVPRVDLRHLLPPTVTGVATVRSESVVIELAPTEGLSEVRAVAASQLGVPASSGFQPHLSVAYANAHGSTEPLQREIGLIPALGPWKIDEVSLVSVVQRPGQRRGPDAGWYEWTRLAQMKIGSS